MRNLLAIIICFVIVFSFAACNKDDKAAFTQTKPQTIVASDGTEYVFVGFDFNVWCFGEWDFIGHVSGEKETFVHLFGEIKTGMYSVDGKQDVLVRYYPDNEFAAMYVKSGLLKTDVTLDNCIRFEFVKNISDNDAITNSNKGITDCENFLDEIRNGQTAKEAGLYDLVKQPDGRLENCYVYGYICGVVQEDVNIVIPLTVTSFDDKAYSIRIDDVEYVLPQEWADKLMPTTTTAHPKFTWGNLSRPGDVNPPSDVYNEDEASWLTFSNTDYEAEREAVMLWLKDDLDVIKGAMGDDYYEPQIYIAKHDMDNDGVEDFVTVISHIAYTGSAGDSLYIMFYDGEKVVAEERICNCRVDLDALKNEGNKQIGIFPRDQYNDLYVMGNIWLCGYRYGAQ